MSRLEGRIQNINSSKYTVSVNDTFYDCTLRGIFRKDKIVPFVGDYVTIDDSVNQIIEIKTRKNYLDRPNIANIDYAVVVVSVKKPSLDLILLDKLLLEIENKNIDSIICFTKVDLLDTDELEYFNSVKDYYSKIGYKAFINTDISEFKDFVKGKVIVCAGQTGAGKSTFINKIDNTLNLKTSPISDNFDRGVHTTRMVSLYKIDDFYIADTPGFSFIDITKRTDEEIRNGFIEFRKYDCKYRDCSHIDTFGCEVQDNVDILKSRYDNYKKFIKEKHESCGKFFS